jgi:Spy/CpxP family protein refolding chaperone
MKKTATVLAIGILIAAVTGFHALAGPLGPPPGPPPYGGEFFGGPPGPPPGPPHHGGMFAGGPLGPPPGPPQHGGIFAGLSVGPPDLIERLKLTDDQLKEMRLAYVDFQDRTRKARSTLMALRDEKWSMLISGKIDQAKLAKWDEEITKLAATLMGEKLKMERERLSTLTAEQVDRLAAFLSQGKIVHGSKMKGR